MRFHVCLFSLLTVGALWQPSAPVHAEGYDAALHSQVVGNAVRYLRARGQAADGSFSAGAGPGITAIVTTGLLRNGYSIDDPLVANSLKYLKGFVREDGGIYAEGSLYRNYETCMTLMCFNEAEKQRAGQYGKMLQRAENFIKGIQNDEGEGLDKSDPAYGGTGYGKHKRPDLSNTGIFIDTLKELGRGEDDEALQRAILFVSRCQNLETEHNTTKWATKNGDGGFYYTGAAGGSSQAKWPEGESEEARGLRSYGSMTYVGLKSLIYAGVSKDDPRVKAATKWIGKHYQIDANPGLGKQGLFYYYQTFGKTLSALGEETFVDAKGVAHDWRAEILGELAKTQKANGAWVNENERWLEGDPNLVTGYALLTLSYCRVPLKVAAGE